VEKISIIIPTYNSSQTIGQLLTSIETIKECEIIVVDDKSQASEYEKLKEICFDYPNVILLQNSSGQKGAGVCRNIGILQATGEWLLFADSDDYFVSDAVRVLNQYRNDDTSDIIYFKPTSIDITTGELATRHTNYAKLVTDYLAELDLFHENRLRCFFEVPWSKLIRRGFVIDNNINFDETIVANDILFSAKVGVLASKISAINQVIYCVTASNRSLTATDDFERKLIRYEAFLRRVRFLMDHLSEDSFKAIGYSKLQLFYGGLKIASFKVVSDYISQANLSSLKLLPRASWVVNRISSRVVLDPRQRRLRKIEKKRSSLKK
jgi:glycosyltransferase involved in cell wall biosynthesis